jgi:signal transduction histidine kinase
MSSTGQLVRVAGYLIALVGIVSFVLALLIGDLLFSKLWRIEPLTYIGAVLVILGLGLVSASYVITWILGRNTTDSSVDLVPAERWSQITQQYFDLFNHDLGRPLRRILGKERELRAIVRSSGVAIDPEVEDLLNEIEQQTPNFRIMMSNIQVLVQLEAPNVSPRFQTVEPAAVVRNIVDRYSSTVSDVHKEISWWTDPSEFGIVYADSSAIEHIVTNLVDNAVRFATTKIEVKISKNLSHFFIRIWDDGPGIGAQYVQHVFDRGWTPEVARRDEKTSSGLGLFIARTLANRCGGDLTMESVAAPDPKHHTTFFLSLPWEGPR